MLCVEQMAGTMPDASLGHFCFWRRDSFDFGGPRGSCTAFRPAPRVQSITSTDGTFDYVCTGRSCMALHDCGRSCMGDEDCGAVGVDDAFCEGGALCTLLCDSDVDCPFYSYCVLAGGTRSCTATLP